MSCDERTTGIDSRGREWNGLSARDLVFTGLLLNLPGIDLGAGYLHNSVLLLQPLKLLVLSRKLLLIVVRRIAPAAGQPEETDLPAGAGN